MNPLICIGDSLSHQNVYNYLDRILEEILILSPQSILFVPPDITRINSQAGFITSYLHQKLPLRIKKAVLPATGLHRPMTSYEKEVMFGKEFSQMKFYDHNAYLNSENEIWGRLTRLDTKKIFGDIQKQWEYLWEEIEIIINKKLLEFDLVLSIGQVLPHEITGMANYHKNILIGLGGEDFINKSHFVGAIIGIPNIIGQVQNSIRDFLKLAYDRFVRPRTQIHFIFTVIGSDACNDNLTNQGREKIVGLFYGDDDDLFYKAAQLSKQKNISWVSPVCDRVWVHMPQEKYHSLWLANKAIYRTLEIIKKGGELIIDAPGIKSWGENPIMNKLIFDCGYISVDKIMNCLKTEFLGKKPLQLLSQLAVAAHLIHGYQTNHRIIFVDYFKKTNNQSKFFDYKKIGFDSIPEKQFEKQILKNFPSYHSLKDLYSYKSLSQINNGLHNYFINDAGLGFWKTS